MPNENEDPLKRTMALIDEHKDKFSDGLYLEIATNMHKAWSDRARNLRFDETAANRETTRGTNTGDPGLPRFTYATQPPPMTLAQPQAIVASPRHYQRIETYQVKGQLLPPDAGRFVLDFKCQNVFSTGFSSSSRGVRQEWSTENAWTSIGITVTDWVGTLSFVDSEGHSSVAALMECTKLRKHDSSRGRYGDIDTSELLNFHADFTSMMVSFLSDLQEVNEEWTQRACMLVKKMTVLDSRFLGLGIPLKMIDMADYMVNDNRSLLLIDPLYLVRDFCRDEMIIPDGMNGEECLDLLRQYYKKIGIQQSWREEKYIGRWNGVPYPSANAVCPHLTAFSLPLLRDIANVN